MLHRWWYIFVTLWLCIVMTCHYYVSWRCWGKWLGRHRGEWQCWRFEGLRIVLAMTGVCLKMGSHTYSHESMAIFLSSNQPIEGYPIFRATSNMFQLQPLSNVWRRLKKAKLEFSFCALIHGDRSWSSSRLSCFCWNWFCHNLRPEHLRCFTWGQIPLWHEGFLLNLFMCGRRNPHGAPSMNP